MSRRSRRGACFGGSGGLYTAMRLLVGFVLGIAMGVVALFFVQRELARVAAPDFEYQFGAYVFSGEEFPFGDIAQGRVLHRVLFPVKITRTFYNARFEEVSRATEPGRYGAVVRIAVNGAVEKRYITLYHTMTPVYWADGPMTMTTVLPPGTGIDPAVSQVQMEQIANVFKDEVRDEPSEHLAKLLAGLSETRAGDPPSTARDNFFARDDAWWFEMRKRLGQPVTYPCLVDLPQGYADDPGKRWPLLLYLPGMGERGEDLNILRHTGLGKVVAEGRKIPAIAISPQVPNNADWSVPALAKLLDELPAKYRIDTDRIYLLGSSSGGEAVWHLAVTYPDRFAAVVAMAGESRDDDFARIKDLPAWVFEGTKDDTVDPEASLAVPAAMARAGGHPHVTMVPDAGHDCWDAALARDELYTWLLAQRRGQAEVVPAGVVF